MKFNPKIFDLKIQKNLEFVFVLILILVSIIITQIFNFYKDTSKKEFIKLVNNLYFQKTLNNIFENLNPQYSHIEHVVSTGETLNGILINYNVSTKEINFVIKNLGKKTKIEKLKVNEKIKFTINTSDNKISKIIFPISKTKKIELVRNFKNDSFIKREIITNLKKRNIYAEGRITQSLYKSAVNKNIPPSIIVEFARIYGFQIDFQRDIQKNDSFQIIYEIFEDENKKVFNTGNILYADLNLSNQSNAFYYFKDKKKEEGHYDLNGKSVKKALMKTPINGARLSSPFGMRKHPIDGFNKMHRGTDFAAPKGTPVMASGDGIIIKAAWCGGGGNCVKIKHNSTYSTIYAHLSKFSGISRKGKRVKQGQVIGYVGSTGKSTGPHLHYEVIKNGKKINSQTLKLPSGKILKGNERKLFEIKKIKIDVLKSEMIAGLI